MVENGNPVGAQPDVALEAGRPQTQGQAEGDEAVVVGVGPTSPVGERDRRAPERVEDGPTVEGRLTWVPTPPAGYDEVMEAFWLLLIPVALIGGYFLIRSFARLSKSIGELRTAMTDLADAGIALNEVQAEVARLGDSLDEVRRQ